MKKKRKEKKKIWTDALLKKIANKHTKICSLSYVFRELGNCKLKQQWDTTTHILEWLKPKTLKTPTH